MRRTALLLSTIFLIEVFLSACGSTPQPTQTSPSTIVRAPPPTEALTSTPTFKVGAVRTPHDVDRLSDGHTLITDGGKAGRDQQGSGSRIFEVDAAGNIVWSFDQGLRWAHNADRLSNGDTLISDTGHDRVIEVDAAGTIVWNSDDVTLSDGSHLRYPNDANWLPDDHILITDRDNHRVIEIDRQGNILWQFGETGVPGDDASHLNGPHNADRLSNGVTIIVDSNNNRVIEVAPDGTVVWEYRPAGAEALNWPRDADRLPDDNTLITDSRNGRVIEVTRAGQVVWEYADLNLPYDADRLPNGHTLISGAPGGRVIEVDATGTIVWQYPSAGTLTSTALTSVTLTPLPATPMPTSGNVPPLYVFYVIHVHAAGDHLPYDSPALQTLDPEVAQNMLAQIEGIARALETYGAKGTWEVVYGTAQGLCAFEGENHIFRRLVEAGHEVGLHVHNYGDYQSDYDAVHDACGLDPTVTSGLIVGTANLPDEEAHARVAAAIQTNLGFGVQVGTINMNRNAFMARCGGQIGEGNDMGEQTGNLMFPWRPDLEEPNVCADDPNGDFVLVDHVDMAAWVRPAGSGPTGHGGVAITQQPAGRSLTDLLSQEDFERLRALFDAALRYMEENRPQQVAVWGFVTHIHEYAVGNKGENPPDPEALAALDRFLAYVAEKAAEGRVVFATAGEISRAAFPGPGNEP